MPKKTARARRSSDRVTLRRGGRSISLYKSPHLVSVRLKSGVVGEKLPGRLISELQLPSSVRFVKRFPGSRIGVFHCPPSQRNEVMERLRNAKDLVQYCSHVLLRTQDDSLPQTDIGLDDKIFVEFKSNPSRDHISAIEQEGELRAIWRFPELPTCVVFQLTERATKNPIKISNDLMRSKRYRTVEPSLIDVKASRAVPSDAAFRYQWHLLNTGQGGGKVGADCNVTAAWDYTWGDLKVVIAMIDDGFDMDHPDFGPDKFRHPYDATERDWNPRPSDFRDNHGTSCAGVCGAARGGGLTVGVAPDCSLMPIRHAGQLGDFEEALAFYHAYRYGADVISCSWGPPDAYLDEFWPMPSLTRALIDLCVVYGRDGRGIAVFFAAGNGNEPLALDGYANYENVIAVAASTNEDEKAYYSDYGENVWVTAPSSGGTRDIFTVDRLGSQGYNDISDYTAEFGGTSSSTPLVAGVAGLMLSVNPDLTVRQIREILKNTAVKIGDDVYEYDDHWGNVYTDEYDERGHSAVFGWGRVDAGAAVLAAYQLSKT